MNYFSVTSIAVICSLSSPADAATYKFDATLTGFNHDWISVDPTGDTIWRYAPTDEQRAALSSFDLVPFGVPVEGTLRVEEDRSDFSVAIAGWSSRSGGGDPTCSSDCVYGAVNTSLRFSYPGRDVVATFTFDPPAAPAEASTSGTFRYQDSDDGNYLDPLGTGMSYYWHGLDVTFDITNFEEVAEIPHMPLPGSAPFLAAGLGAFFWLRRRRGL